jgi:hypothetical protein
MKKIYIVIFVVVFLLAIAGVFFGRATTIYSAQVVVTEKGSNIGMAPFTDRVDFGDIPQGSGVSKTITLDNLGDNDNNIKVYTMGSIWSFIDIEPGASFTLGGGQSQDIVLKMLIPETAPVGKKYTGRIFILRLP